MFQKQNKAPCKQGAFYQLNLNKNNGPFLSKDIMFTNPRSTTLITNADILREHEKIAETLIRLQKTVEMRSCEQSNTGNFVSTVIACEEGLARSGRLSQELRQEENRLRRDFEQLQERIITSNNQLTESATPFLKNLLKKVKDANQLDKAQYYTIFKQLQEMEMEKRALEHIVLSCKMRIDDLQKVFGVGSGKIASVNSRGLPISNNFFTSY